MSARGYTRCCRYLSHLSHSASSPAFHLSRLLTTTSPTSSTSALTPRPVLGPMVISILGSPQHPALSSIPKFPSTVKLFIGDKVDYFLKFPQFKETEIVIALSGISAKFLEEIWPHLPNVRWLHSFLTGIDAIAPFLKSTTLSTLSPSLPVTNGRGAFSTSLAEYVLAMILYFNKQVPRLVANQKDKKWEKFTMNVLTNRVIGLVGFGHIGQETAELLTRCDLGMKLIALHRTAGKKKETDTGAAKENKSTSPRWKIEEFYPLEKKYEFFGKCDFVVCSLPGTPETYNFMSKSEFASMKPSGYFINVGRGTVVDEHALAQAVKIKTIAGAALDVFQQEPLPKESPLWGIENILLSSHNADYTSDYYALGWNIFERNFQCYQEKKPLLTPVDKNVGY